MAEQLFSEMHGAFILINQRKLKRIKIYPEMSQGIYKKWFFHHVIWSVEKQLSRHNSSIVNEDGHITDFFF